MATSTPWGAAQYSKHYARGIVSYNTAGHGGFHVSSKLNMKIPDFMRAKDGWYEEDCEWAKVAVIFPEFFDAKTVAAAKESLKNWDYKAYEKLYNIKLKAGESREKDEETFKKRHANNYMVMSASRESNSDKMVKCFAGRGGRVNVGGSSLYPEACKTFLVPVKEYEKRGPFGFVINEKKHKEVAE